MMLTKRDVKRIFCVAGVTDEEAQSMVQFVRNTMIGCDWEAKAWPDFCAFNAEHKPNWIKLYRRHVQVAAERGVKEWAVFTPGSDTVVFVTHETNAQGWTVESTECTAPLSEYTTR